jgi:hypothetical protein
VAAVLVVRV